MHVLRQHWFLILLSLTVLLGMVEAERLAWFAKIVPRDWIIGSVLLAMTLPLRIHAIGSTLRRPAAALLGVTINLWIVPLLAFVASLLLSDDLALGLLVAAAVPCTLASASVWTRLAGGNEAVSLLVTIITNLSCFVVTPALIHFFAGPTNVSIGFVEMTIKLLLLIVVPMVVAQLLRALPIVGSWATANQRGLSLYAQLGILPIVFVGAVNCGAKIAALDHQLAPIAGQIVLMMILAAAVHLTALGIGYWTAGRLGMPKADQIAVAFAGSQKTLMVGLAIAISFGGLTVLPMLAYHVEQLLFDTIVANQLRHNHPTDRQETGSHATSPRE